MTMRILMFTLWLGSAGLAMADTVFYLHGKIVEDQGDKAVHPQYGVYEYSDIVARLRQHGHSVYSERRPPDTDRLIYAKQIVGEIQALVDGGLNPREIVVIGFSKGAQIAILVSEALANPDIRFVLQAVCGSWVEHFTELKVYGKILSLYETSDRAGSCSDLFRRSNASTCEIPISTGLQHGAFYQPNLAWLLPQQKWISEGLCEGAQPAGG